MTDQPVSLHRELRSWETLGLSIAMMSPTLAMALYGGAPAGFIGRAAPLAFVLSGLGVVLVGAGLVYLCRYFSHAGSVYGLIGVTLGPRAGFFSGWALLGTYMIFIPSSLGVSIYFFQLFGQETGLWQGNFFLPVTVFLLALSFALTRRDVKRVSRGLLSIEGVSITVMIAVLVIIVVKLAGGFHGHHLSAKVFSLPAGVSVHTLVLASVFGFAAFAGFEGAASLGEESRNPRRNIPKSLIIAIGGAVMLYVVCVAIMAMGFGVDAAGGAAFAKSSGPLFDLAQAFVGRPLAEILVVGATFSAFGAIIGCTLGAGRLVFAIARDARPGSLLGRVDRHGEPTAAQAVVLLFSLVVSVAMWAAHVDGLHMAFYCGTIGTLSLLVAYAMVDLGAIRLMARIPTIKIAIPGAGFMVMLYVLYNQLYPAPAHPYNYFPYLVAAWLLLGAGVVVLVPGVAKRIGANLAAAEGLQAPVELEGELESSDVSD